VLYTTLPTPVGELLICGDRDEITAVHFGSSPYSPTVGPGWRAEPGAFAAAHEQLVEYFEGRRTRFELPLREPAGTPFLREVWAAVRGIPYGFTSTYGAIAAELNRPRSARAVGLANARNPFAIIVPCHRLLGSTSALRGYAGGLGAKRFLLDHEARISRRESIA
jgi:methylated-DNA-[protein]-cysteine S-methyltransferase